MESLKREGEMPITMIDELLQPWQNKTRQKPLSSSPRPTLSLLWLLSNLLWIKCLLSVGGWPAAVRSLQRRTKGIAVTDSTPSDAVAKFEAEVARACAVFPGRAQCLERSLLLYLVLRQRGIAGRIRLGVQPFPFMAHAWVEYHGEPINDVAEHVAWFTPFEGHQL